MAKLHFATQRYLDDLWESAACALKGRDFQNAARWFNDYLKQEPGTRQAEALAGLGESLVSLDRVDEAVVAFHDCVERYPKDVTAMRARLLASDAYLEKNDTATAERLLMENLNGELLTPASPEYRDSLFALGKLLRQAKRFDEAIQRFDEVISRYGATRQAIEARYLLADCWRRRSIAETGKLADDVIESARAARARKIRDGFAFALESYRRAQQSLLKYQETAELGPVEKLMLRNCYFFIGSMSIELGQYEAAARAYTTAIARYPNLPATLEGYVRMAGAQRAVNKPAEARAAIQDAKLLLTRMATDTSFQQTSNCGRAQWVEVLDGLSKEYGEGGGQ